MTTSAVQQSSHQVAGLSFTAEQLDRRRQTLGASEIPAVAGLTPYRTPLDVWLEKRGLKPAFQGNEFTEWGLRLEEPIAAKYADAFGVTLDRSETVVHADGWQSATPDRLVHDPYGNVYGLEIKNKSAQQVTKWGESGTDQVPHDIAAQVHWSMLVTGIHRWDVAALFGGNEFRVYHLVFNEQIADSLLGIGREFWFDYVQKGVEPAFDGSAAATAYLKQKFAAHTDAMIDASQGRSEVDGWAQELKRAREQRDRLDEECTALENQIKNAIGAAAGIIGRGWRATWKAPKPSVVVDYKGIVEELNPDAALLARYTREKENSRRFLMTWPKEK